MLLLLVGVTQPRLVFAQDLVPARVHATSPSQAVELAHSPEFSRVQEFVLSGLGAGLLATGALLPIDTQVVPVEGLDPAEIAWSVDRDIVGNRDVGLHDTSDWTRNASVLLPFVLGLAISPPENRWEVFGRRSAVYIETLLLSQGATYFLKAALSRPRPFAYLAEGQRPDDPAYDPSMDRTFRSMPSGHSSSAWTGATLAMTDHLLSRPQASGLERFGVGLAAGGLASVTSTLRSASGQHFPTDVIAGAGVGIVSGVVVPLLHRSNAPLPTTEAWLQMAGGTVAGIVLGIVVAR